MPMSTKLAIPAAEREPTKVYTFTLPPSLVAEIDAIAAAENRPRVRQVTTFLQEAVRNWRAAQQRRHSS
jgi:hypothetical protein